MKVPEITSKNFAKLKFLGFFSASVLLCVIIFSSFWSPSSTTPPEDLLQVAGPDNSIAGQLLEVNQVLQAKWIELEQRYDEQTLLVADPSKDNNVSRKQLAEAEILYVKLLDSVAANNATSPSVEKIDSVVNTYRASLQNKQALNNNLNELVYKNSNRQVNMKDDKLVDKRLADLQLVLVSKNDIITKLQSEISATNIAKGSLSANEQKVLQLQKDLQSKTDLITKLQNEVSAASLKNTGANINEQKVRQLQNEVQLKTEMIAKLQTQLKTVPVKNTGSGADDRKINEMQKELQSKTAMIAKLQNQVNALPPRSSGTVAQSSGDPKKMADELEFLKWALRSEVSSNHALTADVNKLKQANATLSNQLKGK